MIFCVRRGGSGSIEVVSAGAVGNGVIEGSCTAPRQSGFSVISSGDIGQPKHFLQSLTELIESII